MESRGTALGRGPRWGWSGPVRPTRALRALARTERKKKNPQ